MQEDRLNTVLNIVGRPLLVVFVLAPLPHAQTPGKGLYPRSLPKWSPNSSSHRFFSQSMAQNVVEVADISFDD